MIDDVDDAAIRVAALYRFTPLDDVAALRQPIAGACCKLGIRGTLILAPEGINGTVAGTPEAIASLLETLSRLVGLTPGDVRFSGAREMPFHRMKVRLKKEIVTLGVDGLDPRSDAGTHVDPADWNALVSDPGTIVIDTRNAYEVRLGSFEGALDPQTESFRAFPAWVAANRERLEGRKIAMFCTGGIRCEKATALMKAEGFDEVYHLRNGILGYLAAVPEAESLWRGECFVFDERVGVVHGLRQGEASLCRACRRPLTPQDRASPLYREGVACHQCSDERDDADRSRYAERHRQVKHNARLGRRHIGS